MKLAPGRPARIACVRSFSFLTRSVASQRNFRILPLAAAVVASAPVSAATALLDTITVTGAREPVPLNDALQDVTVIDRATIEAHAGASLESVLAEQAGTQVASNGGIGSVSKVFVRGANSDSTLLLIDGVRYGSASIGGPVFYNLPLEQIDHIEIVRGPLSSVYGSDAAGGVIQIFTRRGQPGFQASGSATVGTKAYGAINAGASGGAGNLDYAIHTGIQRTDGFPDTNPHVPFGNYNPNNDGFRQTSASANFGYTFLPGWSVRVQGLDARGDVQYADGFDPTRPDLTARSRVETSSGGMVIRGKLAPDWSTTLRYGVSRDDFNTDIAVNAFDLGRFTTTQQIGSWQNDFVTPIGTVLAAAEQLHQSVTSNETSFEVDRRTINGLQLGLNGKAGPHAWQANVRSDANSQFGHQNTGALAYGFELAPQWRIGASAGTSFVMPSFDNLYFPGFGNPALRPQHGRSEELNLRWKTFTQQARLALYENRFRDLIALNTNFLPVNVVRSRIRGASIEYDAHAGAVTIGSTFDAMDPRDLTDGTRLPHLARYSVSLKADWQFASSWSAGGIVQAVGHRYDDALNVRSLGGYGLLGLHCDWRLERDWQLALRVDNATDHHVEPAYGYNAPPRQLFVTLRYGAL
jgi:vitamin B12 transporter